MKIAGTYDSIIYDVVLEETGSPDSFEKHYGRVQMYDSTAFILGALVSAGVAHYASLRAYVATGRSPAQPPP